MLLLNDVPVSFFKFSGGEVQIKLPDIFMERVTLTWKPKCSDDLMKLLLTVNALDHAGYYDVDLDILYLPYARQDRVCSAGEALSLEVICNILNVLDVTIIRFWHVHNAEPMNEWLDSIPNCHITPLQLFSRYNILDGFDLHNLVICAPDEGAMIPVMEICHHFKCGMPIHFEKVRDPETGFIVSTQLNRYCRDVKGYNVLMIDDICDGGKTFIEAAKILKKEGCANLCLYITHGIFSKGLGELQEYFDHIYCHHVLDDSRFKSNSRLTILREENHGA